MISHKKIFQLFVFLLPTQLTLHFWPQFSFVSGIRVDYLAPAIYFVDFLFIAFFSLWVIETRPNLSKHKKLLVLFLAFAALNIVFSQVPVLSLYKWVRVFQFLLVYLYVKENKIGSIIKTPLFLSLVYVSIIGVMQMAKGGSINGILYWMGERRFTQGSPGIALMYPFGNEILRPYATFPHPNVLGGYALVLFYLFNERKWRFYYFAKAICVFLVIISFSQNAWLSFLLTPIIVFLVSYTKQGYMKFVVSAAVASFFLPLFKFSQFAQMEIAQRVELNQMAAKMFSEHTLFGVGLGAFVSMIPAFSSFGLWWLQPAHNIFLLISSEIGILGLLAFCYFLIKNKPNQNVYALVSIILLGMWDHYFLTIFQTSLLFAITLGYNGENKL